MTEPVCVCAGASWVQRWAVQSDRMGDLEPCCSQVVSEAGQSGGATLGPWGPHGLQAVSGVPAVDARSPGASAGSVELGGGEPRASPAGLTSRRTGRQRLSRQRALALAQPGAAVPRPGPGAGIMVSARTEQADHAPSSTG